MVIIKSYEEEISQYFPYWKSLTDTDKMLMTSYASKSMFKKGQNIHGATERCTGAILVESGCVRAYMLSEQGKEVTLYRLFPGDICMLSASCVLQSITFDVMVDAEEDSECFIISGKILKEISERNLEAKNFALEIAVSRFSDVMWIMQQILFMSMDKRLAIFLSDEISKNGTDTINLSNEQIAKYIGSAREVVSRMLKYFTQEGIAVKEHNCIKIINKKKLRKLCV